MDKSDIDGKGIVNPYSRGEFFVRYSGSFRTIRVPRSMSLKFMDDVYNYEMLADAVIVKRFSDHYNDFVYLCRDRYGRMWLHVYWSDDFDDHTEEYFERVIDEREAEARYRETAGGPSYQAHAPYFFSSGDFDLSLTEAVERHGNVQVEMHDILLLNSELADGVHQ